MNQSFRGVHRAETGGRLGGRKDISIGSAVSAVLTNVSDRHTDQLFSERVVKVWNSLPLSIVNFSSLATFRNSLNKINLRICTKY